MSLMDEDEVVGVQVSTQGDTMLIVSENGMGKRTDIDEYTVQHRGGKGVKTLSITDKTGRLVAIKNVTDDNDLMIINKSGIVIRLAVADVRVMGRATQGVRLINLTKKNDVIASVCKVMSSELESTVEEESRAAWAQKSDEIVQDNTALNLTDKEMGASDAVDIEQDDTTNTPEK